jgi:trigger factor
MAKEETLPQSGAASHISSVKGLPPGAPGGEDAENTPGAAIGSEEDASILDEVAVEDIGPCKKKLAFSIPSDEVKKAIGASIGELRRNAILPGFRRGHAPVGLIEKRFGTDIRKEVKANLVFRKYQAALKAKGLDAIADPDVNLDTIELVDDKPFNYELTVEVWPQFELAGFDGMKLEKPWVEPKPEEVEAELKALQMRTTTFEEITAEGAAATDFVICDYTVTAEGKEAASAKDAGIRPEDGVVGRLKIEAAKEALTGKKPGDTVNLAFTIDAEYYQEEFRGKEAQLALNVKGVRRPKTPEATDAWAKELGFESLEELKTVVSRNVVAAKESSADAALRQQVYDKLLQILNFELPEDAVRRQQKAIFRRERQGLQYRGATEEDLAKVNDKLEEASLDKAQKDLKLFFILSKIAEKEGIEATEADVEMRIAELAARYRTTVVKMREHMKREGMLDEVTLEIREEKTVAHILSKAEITQAGPPAEEKETKKAHPKKPRVEKAEPEEKEAPAAPRGMEAATSAAVEVPEEEGKKSRKRAHKKE